MFAADLAIGGNNVSLTGLIVTLVGLIILWIVVSIPVWLAGKAMTGGKGTFGEALLVTLVGPIVYFIASLLVGLFLSAVIGFAAFALGYILALVADLGFQSQFPHGLAFSDRDCDFGMGTLHSVKHHSWRPLWNSLPVTILPKNLKITTITI